jgi:hypothetical protein
MFDVEIDQVTSKVIIIIAIIVIELAVQTLLIMMVEPILMRMGDGTPRRNGHEPTREHPSRVWNKSLQDRGQRIE